MKEVYFFTYLQNEIILVILQILILYVSNNFFSNFMSEIIFIVLLFHTESEMEKCLGNVINNRAYFFAIS